MNKNLEGRGCEEAAKAAEKEEANLVLDNVTHSTSPIPTLTEFFQLLPPQCDN